MKSRNEETISQAYALLMATVFLFAVGPDGYANVTEVKWGAFLAVTAAYLIALAVWAIRQRPKLLHRPSLPQCCLLAYLALTVLSALCSPWRGVALLGGDRCDGALAALAYVLAALALSETAKPGKTLLYAAAAAMTVYAIVCILQLCDRNPLGLFPGELRWSGRGVDYNGAFLGFTGNADLSAAVLCMGAAVCFGGALTGLGVWLLIPAAMSITVLIWAGLQGGMLGAAGGVLLALPGLRKWTKKQTGVYAACAALLLAAGILTVYLLPMEGTLGELHAILHGELSDDFATGRVYIWRSVLPLVKERPLLGAGPDTLGLRAELFFEKQTASGLLRREIDCAHSEYLNIAVNQGIPALLCLMAGTITALMRGRKQGGSAAAILRGAIYAYALQALTGITMPGSTAFFWLCLGLLCACERNERNHPPRRVREEETWTLPS